MISNVASPTNETAGVAPSGAGVAADTGVFEALLALQSLINADAATGVHTQLASALEGADLLAGTQEESTEDSTDEVAEPTDDVLWFLAAPLPTSKVAPPATFAPSTPPVHSEPPQAGAAPPPVLAGNTQEGTADLAQAVVTGTAKTEVLNPQAPILSSAATPVLDTTSWNSLTAPAELFAQAAGPKTERVDSTPLTTHVRDPRWADDLGNRLATMVRTGESSASLQLTPPDLGPLEVNVAVRDNQATVHFGAANAETRALLEASMPRLREMLASQGFQLMDSSVSHGFARQTRHESAGTPRVDGIGESPTTAPTVRITGILDLYA